MFLAFPASTRIGIPPEERKFTMLLLALSALLICSDTLRVRELPAAPAFDGAVSAAEYGAPSFSLTRAQGDVRGWVGRSGSWVYIAVELPDSSFYWGDDVVVSLDVWGDRGAGPGHDDFQWYFRRVLDSSVVYRGDQGKWRAPRDDPDWRLGPERAGGGWEVRSVSGPRGWSLELRLDAQYFREARPGTTPALSLRVYDDSPHGWHAWPAAEVRHPTEVERRPELWVPVTLER